VSENFFLDNPDLQLRLEQLDLREVLELKEKGYTEASRYPTAPRSYADAIDNYRIVGKAADVVPMIIKALRERSTDEAGSWAADDAAEAAGVPAAEGAVQ